MALWISFGHLCSHVVVALGGPANDSQSECTFYVLYKNKNMLNSWMVSSTVSQIIRHTINTSRTKVTRRRKKYISITITSTHHHQPPTSNKYNSKYWHPFRMQQITNRLIIYYTWWMYSSHRHRRRSFFFRCSLCLHVRIQFILIIVHFSFQSLVLIAHSEFITFDVVFVFMSSFR